MRSFLHKILRLPEVPYALPMKDFNPKNEYSWDDYDNDIRKDYPIRNTIVELISRTDIFICGIKNKIKQFIEEHTTNYHIINLKQPENPLYHCYNGGYINACDAIIYANFKILENYIKELKDFYKEQDINSLLIKLNCDYEGFPWYKDQIDIIRIYRWWTHRRIELSKLWEKDPAKYDDIIEKEVTQNLIKLMNIRRSLWI